MASVILVFGSRILAETVDLSRVYKCDDIYCPDSAGNGVPISRSLDQEVGLSVDGGPSQLRSVDRVVISIDPLTPVPEARNQKPQLGPQSGPQLEPESRSQTSLRSESTDSKTNQNYDIQTNTSQSRSQSVPQFNESTGSLGISSNSPQMPSTHNSQIKAGGYLYGEDSKNHSAQQIKHTVSPGSARILTKKINPVELNRQSNPLSKTSDSDQKLQPGNQSLGSGYGAFESGSVTALPEKQSLVAKVQGQLSSIAQSLGNKFFGASGGNRNSYSSNLSPKAASRSSAAKGKKSNLTPDFRSMLNAKRRQYRRNIASSFELGKRESFLFGNMCEHYRSYARSNRIPDDLGRCPTK